MYLRDVLGDAVSDDVEFDDLDDFDYMERFISESEDFDTELDYEDEEFDDLEDLYLDDDEDDFDSASTDTISDDMLADEQEIEVRLVCENCGHIWNDYITEEEDEMDFAVSCPMCGSADISRN